MNLRYKCLITIMRIRRALEDLDPKAHHKCRYCGEEYRGVWSNHRLSSHKVKKHPIQLLVEVVATVMAAVMLLKIFTEIQVEVNNG